METRIIDEYVEVMAPVGNRESLSAAIQAKADSIYFGVGKLNMRSHSANNFNKEDIAEIVCRCHQNHIKAYLTLNTIIYPEDLDDMEELLISARDCGVDAIIAGDIAVIESAHKKGMNVHLSTQTNITNIESIKHFARYADTIVLARELTLDQVCLLSRQIADQSIVGPGGERMRLEMFCHGALCMAVSGKCYMSLDRTNHSANRGDCLQPCRRAYIVYDDETGESVKIDNKYIMSPKDLCTIHFLNKILDSGVRVLKIEGRARDARYVYETVTCYKEAVNAWRNNEYNSFEIQKKIDIWKERLRSVFNRGFWDGYYLGQPIGEWTHQYGNQATIQKVYVGKCTNFFKNISIAEFRVEAVDAIYQDDNLLVTGSTTGIYPITASNMHNDNNTPSGKICQGELFSIKTDRPVHRNDKLYKLVHINT